MLKSLASYENPIFKRQTSRDLQGSIQTDFIGQKIEIDDEEEKDFLDEDSFRSDLERDSAHSSINKNELCQTFKEEEEQEFSNSHLRRPVFSQSLSHDERYKLLQREGNRRASIGMAEQTLPTTGAQSEGTLKHWNDAGVHPGHIQVSVIDQSRRHASTSQQHQNLSRQMSQSESRASRQSKDFDRSIRTNRSHQESGFSRDRTRSSLRLAAQNPRLQVRRQSSNPPPEPPPRPRKQKPKHPIVDDPNYRRPDKPPMKLWNLFGLIDTRKVQCLFGNKPPREFNYLSPSSEVPCTSRSARPFVVQNESQLNNQQPELSPIEEQKLTLDRIERNRGRNDTLFYGSIATFVAGLLLLMSFASPYWLVSWQDTESPFKNMGLWEFCFYKFRHPDYQFDKLFHGCHALYGEEYRLIREKLLPGWLMVVQFFVTLALIFSLVCQMIMVALVLRYPLEVILRFEHHFCGLTFFLNAVIALFLFISVVIFGICCWARDWLFYPNFNYLSWSFAFATFSSAIHIFAALLMYMDTKAAKERKEKNKALIMQMQPPGFSYNGSGGHFGSSGYI